MSNFDGRRQLATFYVGEHFCGIDVVQVQEVARPLPVTPVYLAAEHVLGLSNLRGQIATAIDMGVVLGVPDQANGRMSVISRTNSVLLSLLVDRIGDVIEVTDATSEPAPPTLLESVKKLTEEVHKLPDRILTVIDMNKLIQLLNT